VSVSLQKGEVTSSESNSNVASLLRRLRVVTGSKEETMVIAKTAAAAPASAPASRVVETSFINEVVIPAMVVMAGVIIQITWSAFIGLIVIIVGFFIGMSAGWSADPRLNFCPKLSSAATKRWVQATSTEVVKLKSKMKAVENFNSGCFAALGRFLFSIMVFIIGMSSIGILTAGMPGYFQEDMFGIALIDMVFLGLWYFWICVPSTWKPDLIEFKLPVFESLLSRLPGEGMGNWTREYQLELSKSEKGEVPTDMKLLLKPPKAPKEFLGVQAQVAINRGGPYLYFVVITRPALEISMPDASKSTVLERKNDKEVNILVIRQYANKQGGYITSSEDQARLLSIAKNAADESLSRGA